MTHRILILNGPNLNLLGVRQPKIYGSTTLDDINQQCQARAAALSIALECKQSNHEGELVDWIQQARTQADGLIMNAGAYTHTSVALHDALLAFEGPIIELHVSNIFQREEFRHHSTISSVATAVMCGFGTDGYVMAVEAMSRWLAEPQG